MSFLQMLSAVKREQPQVSPDSPTNGQHQPKRTVTNGASAATNASASAKAANPGSSKTATPSAAVTGSAEQQERIARLKADRARRNAEKEAKEANEKRLKRAEHGAVRAKSSAQAKPASKSGSRTPQTKLASRSDSSRPNSSRFDSSRTAPSRSQSLASASVTSSSPSSSAGKKKLNFKDLMKQAETVDSDRLKLDVKVRKGAPVRKGDRRADREGAERAVRTDSSGISTKASDSKRSSSRGNDRGRPVLQSSVHSPGVSPRPPGSTSASPAPSPGQRSPARSSAPTARPMQSLLDKRNRRMQLERQNRRNGYDEPDSEDDDFIVDDDEDDGGYGGHRDVGYDRDEIWRMFGRRSRSEYVNRDEDISDMETTGSQVFEEEQASARQARYDDLKEERELERLSREKQNRKRRRV